MLPTDRTERLDRHALVMAIWLPLGLVAVTLAHYGFGDGGPLWVLAAFGTVLAAFSGHVIINVALATEFSPREVALGLVLYGCAVVALVLGVLVVDGFAARYFLAVSGGLALLAAAVVFYMLTRFGVRRAFENFDVIRDFNPRHSSRLPRRRRRR
jgi:hypothetical protein